MTLHFQSSRSCTNGLPCQGQAYPAAWAIQLDGEGGMPEGSSVSFNVLVDLLAEL